MAAVKVILDTDIGTDIDDAICLSYLLHNPRCKLLGITTVTGEPEKRAMIASSLCKHAGKEIPIYPGYAEPLRIKQKQRIAFQARSLHKWPNEKEFPKDEAISFLKKAIRKNPGEVILLTVGPLTNIAYLYEEDPEIPTMLKAHIMMGGYYDLKFKGKTKLEWNVRGDYHASHKIFSTPVPELKAVGLDVTMKVNLTADEFKEKFSADEFRPLQDYARHWYHEYVHNITFHDPLAAAVIFNDDIVKFAKGNVTIGLHGKDRRGRTYWEKNPEGKHHVAVSVNKENFFKEYFSVFSK
jgi:purine nucleosidase